MCYNIDIQVYAAASHKLLLEGGVVNWPVNRHVNNSIVYNICTWVVIDNSESEVANRWYTTS